MNAWTFLDRNAHGFFLIAVIAMMYAFVTCGGAEDRVGCKTNVDVKSARDAGE